MALDQAARPDRATPRRGVVRTPWLRLVDLEPEVPRKRGLDGVRCPGALCGCVSEGALCDEGCLGSGLGQVACPCGHDTCRRPIGRL